MASCHRITEILMVLLTGLAACTHQPITIVHFAGDGDGALLRSGKKLKQTHFVAPEYPPALVRSRIEGTVEIEFDVRADGSVTNVVVFKSAHPKLDSLALAAVEKWQFERQQILSEERFRLRIPIDFKVQQTRR